MNRRLTTILLTAFLVAGTCAYVIYRIASARIGAAGPQVAQFVAAKENTPIGTVLSQANLTTIRIAGTPPKGAILKPENAIGRGVIANLYQGEPILEDRLAAAGSGGGLAATIPAGMRACAVKVDDVVGVAGFVTPGMRVDVLTSGSPSGMSNQGIMANTILQNIEVLSAGTDIQKDDQGKAKPVKVVNLLVTPEQAEALTLASNHLTIQLVLRNPLDTKLTNVSRTSLASLLSEEKPAPAVVKRAVAKVIYKETPKPFSIEIISGSKRSEMTVAVTEGQK
ncbi:MAG: Flp pilus assembly protein CpaB [Terracidiphilus sp.]|nr:Flp pilus assembly protein CpaB [Terracidiphilus sp.]